MEGDKEEHQEPKVEEHHEKKVEEHQEEKVEELHEKKVEKLHEKKVEEHLKKKVEERHDVLKTEPVHPSSEAHESVKGELKFEKLHLSTPV